MIKDYPKCTAQWFDETIKDRQRRQKYEHKDYDTLVKKFLGDNGDDIFAKKYTEKTFIEEKLGGVPLDKVLKLLKEHYPENFI